MQIILYRIDCEARELAKGWYIENATSKLTLDGTLREQCSVIAPSIAFGRTILALHNYNYAYIKDFDRYYFIVDMTTIRDSLTRIDFRCDVLYSFRSNLTSSSSLLFCERWSGSTDKLINDNLRDYETNKVITEVRADTLTTSGVTLDNWEPKWGNLGYNWALSIVSNKNYGGLLGIVTLPTLLHNIVPNLYPENYNGNDFNATFACTSTYITNLLGLWISQKDNVAQSVISIDVYPFNLYQKTEFNYITIGETEITGLTGIAHPYLTEPRAQLLADFTPIKTIEDLDYNVMKTKYELWLPFDKWITLNPEEIQHQRVLVYYVPTFLYRQCNIYVITATGHLLYTNTISICNTIPINRSNAQAILDSYTQSVIGVGAGMISTAIGAMSANPYMISKSSGDVFGGVGKMVSTALTTHPTLTTTSPNGNSGINSARHVIFRVTRPNPVIRDDDELFENYKETFGLPYMTTINGSFLTNAEHMGTYFFGECHIPFADASKGEIEELKSILKQGITITKAYS